ncbi:MAG TPA: sigma-70 family RNA polymerase sigma factor [Actinomycetota bacterium]|jgi:RNA polymerase sigma-70 factor, ECF subfamily|nr:sigma-70 family RNA polymerase sigma factor [Actinomycetota bacterium]
MQARALDMDVLGEADDKTLAAHAPENFEAFAELYRRYLCPVYRFMRSQVGDEATAEDLTAHVFFKALSSASSYRAEGSYSSWIFRIAHNSLSTWRQRAGRDAVVTEEIPDGVDPTPSPASQVIVGEERGLVWETVAALPPAQREVVALRYIEDFSIEEVATITRRSRGAVRILLHRARTRLRKALDGKDIG